MADGTGIPTGRVGSCHIYLIKPLQLFVKAFLCPRGLAVIDLEDVILRLVSESLCFYELMLQ